MTVQGATTQEWDAVAAEIPLGPVHVHGCRCHGDGDPAATHVGLGVVDGQWYAPECVTHARRAHARKREVVGGVLIALRPFMHDRQASAWDEGFDAGHQAARAVNPEWPTMPANPYRTADQEGHDG